MDRYEIVVGSGSLLYSIEPNDLINDIRHCTKFLSNLDIIKDWMFKNGLETNGLDGLKILGNNLIDLGKHMYSEFTKFDTATTDLGLIYTFGTWYDIGHKIGFYTQKYLDNK